MSMDFDVLMNAFWIGFACMSASLISRRESVVAVLVFWVACFPILENLVRAVLRAIFKAHPDNLWSLALAAATSYVLAFLIAATRISRHRRRVSQIHPQIWK